MLAGVRRVALLSSLALACTLRGDGGLLEEERTLAYFDVVEVFDEFAVTLRVDAGAVAGETQLVEVRGDTNAMDRLFTQVHAEATLSINVDPNHLTSLTTTPSLSARLPALTRVYATDASVVQISGAGEALALELHGDATLTLREADAVALDVIAADAAALTLAGAGPALTLAVSGAATVDARRFAAAAVIVDAQGDGEIVVCSTGAAQIAGPGAARVVRRCG